MAVFRYRCVWLVRACMTPQDLVLVQSVIHGRWSGGPQKIIWAVVRDTETGTAIPPGLGISECAVTVNQPVLAR